MTLIASSALIIILFVGIQFLQKWPYKKAYPFYEAAHFLTGFFIAMLLSSFVAESAMIIWYTVAIGFVWEIAEAIVYNVPYLRQKTAVRGITTKDTVFDLFLDALGAITFVVLFA